MKHRNKIFTGTVMVCLRGVKGKKFVFSRNSLQRRRGSMFGRESSFLCLMGAISTFLGHGRFCMQIVKNYFLKILIRNKLGENDSHLLLFEICLIPTVASGGGDDRRGKLFLGVVNNILKNLFTTL